MHNPDTTPGILVPGDTQDDIGMMMEAQLAIMRPFSKVGIKARRISANLKGVVGIRLSAAACLWLSRQYVR